MRTAASQCRVRASRPSQITLDAQPAEINLFTACHRAEPLRHG